MFKPLHHRKAVTALMTAALALVVLAPSAQAVTTISTDLDTDGLLTVDGAVTLGNGTATAAVNTSDWGITTAGAMTGVSFDANGAGNSLSNIDAADLTIDSLDFAQFADALSIDSATITGTWTDLGSVTTVDINGGSLDGVIIGGASPAAATLTTLSMSDLATWSAGAAITAGSYQIGRDADATNQLHFNVPTGASMEWSVNDSAVMTLSTSGSVQADGGYTSDTGTYGTTGTLVPLVLESTLANTGGVDTAARIDFTADLEAADYALRVSDAGNTILDLMGDGSAYLPTSLGIGTTPQTSSNLLVVRKGTKTSTLGDTNDAGISVQHGITKTTGTGFGQSVYTQANPGADSTANYYGLNSLTHTHSDWTQNITGTGKLVGLWGGVQTQGSGTLVAARGVYASVFTSTGTSTITDGMAVYALAGANAAGTTLTRGYAVYAADPTNTGTLVSAAQFFAEEPAGATNNFGLVLGAAATTFPTTGNWSIYNASTRENFFGGNLTMGNDALVKRDTNAGLTASTTQTQGQGALTAEVNEVATVANPNDTVTLPTAVAGLRIVVINNGANTLQIFPASGDNLGAGADTATTLAAGSNVMYQAFDATNWEVI